MSLSNTLRAAAFNGLSMTRLRNKGSVGRVPASYLFQYRARLERLRFGHSEVGEL
jgi:hypothetical protein